MKIMERNKSRFWYSLYKGKTEKLDEYGNITGEFEIIRGNLRECKANISAAKGETSTRQFGESEGYDKVIVMGEGYPDIDEYTVLWIDTAPVIAEDGTTQTPYDYIVKKVAKSLNSVSIAISKVQVDG